MRGNVRTNNKLPSARIVAFARRHRGAVLVLGCVLGKFLGRDKLYTINTCKASAYIGWLQERSAIWMRKDNKYAYC